MKRRMYGQRILEFVKSVDIVDQGIFNDLMSLVQLYVQNHLEIAYFAILEESLVDEQRGLRTLYSTRDEKPSYTADKESGYASHSAYTFVENKPLWVVSASKQPLKDANDCKDLWSSSDNLPGYIARHDDVRTSVMHPLRKEHRPIGVVEFAAKAYIEPTPASQEEVRTLAEVIERAYRMFDVGRDHRENTRSALESLKNALEAEQWTRLALPRMFIAYPGTERLKEEARSDHEAVIDAIRGALDEFSGKIEPIFWSDVTDSGNINLHVIESICNSDFGLCYLSEPVKGDKIKFSDNPNVLFEAGMMQALRQSPAARLEGWIPVREKASPPMPFDIAAERTVCVPRREGGRLDKDAFSGELRRQMKSLVEE